MTNSSSYRWQTKGKHLFRRKNVMKMVLTLTNFEFKCSLFEYSFKKSTFLQMDEEKLEEIYKEYAKQKRRLLRATQSFLDNSTFTETQSKSLLKYHGIIQQVLEEVENAIQNNEAAKTIIEASQNIEKAFNRYAKRIVSYDGEQTVDYESDFDQIREYIRKIVDSLTEKLTPGPPDEPQATINHESKKSTKKSQEATNQSSKHSKNQQEDDDEVKSSKKTTSSSKNVNSSTQFKQSKSIRNDDDFDIMDVQSVRGATKTQKSVSPEDVKRKRSPLTPDDENSVQSPPNPKQQQQKYDDPSTRKSEKTTSQKIQARGINFGSPNEKIENENHSRINLSKSQIIRNTQPPILKNPIANDQQMDEYDPEELETQIQILQKQIQFAKQRIKEDEKRKAVLQQQSVNWNKYKVIEEPEDPDAALVDLLVQHQQALEERIQYAEIERDIYSTEINFRQIQKEQLIETFKQKQESNRMEIKSLLDDLNEDKTEIKMMERDIAKIEREIQETHESIDDEQEEIQLLSNALTQLSDQVNYLKNSNKELNAEIKNEKRNYEDLENDIQRILDEMPLNTNFDAKYRQMIDAEVKLFNAKKEYDTLVNVTISNSQNKLQKLIKEVGHLGARNKANQIEAELVNMDFLKEQIFNLYQF